MHSQIRHPARTNCFFVSTSLLFEALWCGSFSPVFFWLEIGRFILILFAYICIVLLLFLIDISNICQIVPSSVFFLQLGEVVRPCWRSSWPDLFFTLWCPNCNPATPAICASQASRHTQRFPSNTSCTHTFFGLIWNLYSYLDVPQLSLQLQDAPVLQLQMYLSFRTVGLSTHPSPYLVLWVDI